MIHKWQDAPFKNPIARARGLGAVGTGYDHWWLQRVTAVSNIVLMIWAICAVVSLVGSDYTTFTLWLAQPLHAILLSLFILSTFIHAALGLQIIVEDYVHGEFSKVLILIAIRLTLTALAFTALFSILKIAI